MSLNHRIENLTPSQRALLDRMLATSASVAVAEPEVPLRPSRLPLSPTQEGMWFIQQMHPATAAYHDAHAARITGPLDPNAARQALQAIVDRHEALRTAFPLEDGQPRQAIADAVPVALPVEDLTGVPTARRVDEARRRAQAAAEMPFDLGRGPLFHARLFRLGVDDHVLLLSLHHLVSDGWSQGVVLREFAAHYEATRAGRPAGLPPLPLQYADYALERRRHLSGPTRERLVDFWRTALDGAETVLDLPTDRPRPAVARFRGRRLHQPLDAALRDGLEACARANDATLFMALLTAFELLLHRYTGQTQFLVGTPVAGREEPAWETLIGLFVNTTVMRADWRAEPGDTRPGGPGFAEALRRTRRFALDAFAHQALPLKAITEAARPARSLSRHPLFQTLFVFQNAPLPPFDFAGLTLRPFALPRTTAQFDLSLAAEPTDAGLDLFWEYDTDLFDEATIRRMMAHFERLTRAALADPERPVARLPMLTDAEHDQRRAWNATARPGPAQTDPAQAAPPNLVAGFEAQAVRTPDAAAVVANAGTLTYADLNARANTLAHRLRAEGIGPGDFVPVWMAPGPALPVAWLAVMKTGAAFAPLDVRWPAARLREALATLGGAVVLTDQPDPVPGAPGRFVRVDAEVASGDDTGNLGVEIGPSDPIYALFTSGSTGAPKAVVVPHRGIANRFAWMSEVFGHTPAVVLQTTAPVFDSAVWQLFWPLMHGGRTVLTEGGPPDAEAFARRIARHGVTLTDLVPSLFDAFVPIWAERADLRAQLGSLRTLILGGEAITPETTRRFRALVPGTRVFNLYGPTEASIGCVFHEVSGEEAVIPIGRPISNVQVFVMDRFGTPCPVGLPGELCLAGDCVGIGYLGAPGPTARAFVPAPPEASSARMYRTGDRVRRRADGTLEFLGRIDDQIKLRGLRIEPGEIERALERDASVRRAVVVVHEGAGGRPQLVGFVVPEVVPEIVPEVAPTAASAFDAEAVRTRLRETLPPHLIPSALIPLDALPVAASGKIDRRALAASEATHARADRADAASAPPENDAERTLAAVWADVLGRDAIGRHDNFFDLGGDSILSLQIVYRARQAGLLLRPDHLFSHQTVADLATVATPAAAPRSAVAPATGAVPLTPIQRWFADEAFADADHWNQSVVLRMRQAANPAVLRRALADVLTHHDAFRLRLRRSADGAWRQAYAPPEPFPEATLEHYDLRALAPDERAGVFSETTARLQKSLSLAEGPVVAGALFEGGAPAAHAGPQLFLTAHHAVIDSVSWRIVVEDLATAYEQRLAGGAVALPPVTDAYGAWAEALHAATAAGTFDAEADFWRRQHAPAPLPADHPHDGPLPEGTARTHVQNFDAATTAALLRTGGTVLDRLLAAAAHTFAQWTGHPEVGFLLESHGRDDLDGAVDVGRTAGWFTAQYPLVLRDEDRWDARRRLVEVIARRRAVPRHGVGYGALRYLHPDPDLRDALSALPAPAIVFNYLGVLDPPADAPFVLDDAPHGPDRSPRAHRTNTLALDAEVADGRLRVTWRYSPERHTAATLARLADDFAAALAPLLDAEAAPPETTAVPAEVCDRLRVRYPDMTDAYPLSPGQEGILFHARLDPASPVYFGQISARVAGPVEEAALEAAWRDLFAAHAVLRTAFVWDGLDRPLQVVRAAVDFAFERYDWRHVPEAEMAGRREAFLAEDRVRGFDLAEAPLARVSWIALAEGALLVWSTHHLLFDGWSSASLLGELMERYAARVEGRAPHLAVRRPYRDFIDHLARQPDHAAFWRERLAGFDAPVTLPLARPATALETPRAAVRHALSADATARLRAWARRHRLTLNTLVQGAWACLLHQYTGRRDVVFGVTVSGRPADLPGADAMIGMFINTVPLRVRMDDRAALPGWLRVLQAELQAISRHAATSLADIQLGSALEPGTPLFESILVFENYPLDQRMRDDAEALPVPLADPEVYGHSNFPLTLMVLPEDRLTFVLKYATDTFAADDLARVLAHLAHLLTAFPTAEEAAAEEAALMPPTRLPMLAPVARTRLLDDWNRTTDAALPTATFPALFEAQVARTPHATALVYEDEAVSYDALNRRANRLAARLRRAGVGPEDRVALVLPRSAELVVALLGVLKSGAAYVPLDPAYPPERLAFMLRDADVRAVLGDAALARAAEAAWVPVPGGELIDESSDEPGDEPGDEDHPASYPAPENAAYVIYTSGSTGQPKGVVVEHRQLMAYIEAARSLMALPEAFTAATLSTLAFDGPVQMLFPPLLGGGAFHLTHADRAADPEAVADYFARHPVDVLKIVPSHLTALLQARRPADVLPRRLLVLGGEASTWGLVRRIRALAPGLKIVNHYGPTETTVGASAWPLGGRTGDDDRATVPIGTPLDRARLYVLGPHGEVQPVGVPGELMIGGAMVTRGYHGQPARTAERFLPDPFSPTPGARMYRTGDRVHHREDGALAFLGRADRQVKIRGFRIELGEIEAALVRHPEVETALVRVDGEEAAARLVAYLVPRPGGALSSVSHSAALRGFLAERLTDAMIPAHFLVLEALPLTAAGKLDVRALPSPEAAGGASRPEHVAPRDPFEETVATVWAEVLRRDAVSMTDDFFALGGHSLLATQVASRLRERLSMDVPLRMLFTHRTAEALALALAEQQFAALDDDARRALLGTDA